MAAAAVRPVGAKLGAATYEQCEEAAEAALAARDPMAARETVRLVLG
jgi:phosphotransferase system enzyme I (PtsI)